MSYLLYSIILVFASFLSIGLGIYGYLNREKPGMAAFSIFMFLLAVWPMVQAFDIATANLTYKIILMKLRFDAPIFAGLAYLVMVLQLIGSSKWVTKERLIILSIIPILGAILNWTSPNLLFRYDFHVSMSGPFPILLWSNGALFWVYLLYLYALYLVPIFLLANSYRTISPLSSRKILILIVAITIPLITDILFRISISPIVGFNLTPLTQVFLGLIIAWGIFYVKAFDTVPIARDKLITDMKDGVIVFDPQNKILDINPSAQQIIGSTEKLALGKSADDVFAPWPDLITHFKDVPDEHTEISVDGNPKLYYDINFTSLKDHRGNLIGNMIIFRDITARKQTDEKLDSIMEDLKRSNIELEQFAYVTSHDLREPLRMITSFLQLLERRYGDELDQDANEFIGFAVDGAKRLNDMINDLLEYSKVTRKEVELSNVNVEKVIEDTLLNLKVPIDENDAEITYDHLPTVDGDEKLMIQLFQNLIGNSIKYHSQETPKIHISTQKEKNQYLFSVSDNSIGISNEYLDRIFTIFQRLHTKDDYEGTGIGLAIAYKIVHQHGGEIWAESEPGKGSTFYFTIPIDVNK